MRGLYEKLRKKYGKRIARSYLRETASGWSVLFYPLSEAAREYIDRFLNEDPYAPPEGRLWRPSYGKVEPLNGPICFVNVSKVLESELDIRELPEEIQELLEAFGVRHRVIQRPVLRSLNFEIKPGELVAIVGASGAGKTTLLRLILSSANGWWEGKYRPTTGRIEVPGNVKASVLIPGEFESNFSSESILEHVYRKIKDINVAVEILNRAGLSDAVLYRASPMRVPELAKKKVRKFRPERPPREA